MKGLVAHARVLAAGARTGAHRSKLLGSGSEFSEYKAYEPGDDLRFLDWKVQARTDRYVVRRFHSDRVRELQIVLDRTGSMAFGTTGDRPAGAWGPWPDSKWEAASTVALALAFIALRQGDRVGLWLVDSGTGQRSLRTLGARGVPGRVPVRGGQRHLNELAAAIGAQAPRGEGSLAATLAHAAAAGRRSEIIVISDLLADDIEEWLAPLGVHAARGREAQVLHVVDPAEIEFPYDEPTLFEDLEVGEELSANPRELARSYREEFGAFLEQAQIGCSQRGVRYLRLNTSEALEDALVPFLRGEDVRRGA
ncbi:MAG: DUF58 domain-containing protein [Deltaproteobacteria bacterium]|nr:DUF58 domain-containing protein [Deltaproteobacteria bacterium]